MVTGQDITRSNQIEGLENPYIFQNKKDPSTNEQILSLSFPEKLPKKSPKAISRNYVPEFFPPGTPAKRLPQSDYASNLPPSWKLVPNVSTQSTPKSHLSLPCTTL